MISRRLNRIWPDLTGRNVLGFGYTGPYLKPYQDSAKATLLAMPAAQGAVVSRSEKGIISSLVNDWALPFPDASFDNVLVVHGIEEAVDVTVLLKELWRVIMPEGHIIVIASNRRGLWAQTDHTPFGHGRPFSPRQVRQAMEQANFVTTPASGLLFSPPMKFFARPKRSFLTERVGEILLRPMAGVNIVQGVKRIYAERNPGIMQKVKTGPVKGALPGIAPSQNSRADEPS